MGCTDSSLVFVTVEAPIPLDFYNHSVVRYPAYPSVFTSIVAVDAGNGEESWRFTGTPLALLLCGWDFALSLGRCSGVRPALAQPPSQRVRSVAQSLSGQWVWGLRMAI